MYLRSTEELLKVLSDEEASAGLYNLYDSGPHGENLRPSADAPAVEKLRQSHVDLLDTVLRAYGWDNIANDNRRKDWTFDRPWLDRPQRFVPPEPVCAKLFACIDKLNPERFQRERDMMVGIIADHLPDDGLTKTGLHETRTLHRHAHRQRPILGIHAVGSREGSWGPR